MLCTDREAGECRGGLVGELDDGPRNPRCIDECGVLRVSNDFGPLKSYGRGESGTVFVVHGLEKREGPAGLHPVLVSISDKELFTRFNGAGGNDRNSSLDDDESTDLFVLFGCFVDAAACDAVHSEGVRVDKGGSVWEGEGIIKLGVGVVRRVGDGRAGSALVCCVIPEDGLFLTREEYSSSAVGAMKATSCRSLSDEDVIRLVPTRAEGVELSLVEELEFRGKSRTFLNSGALRAMTLLHGRERVWWRAVQAICRVYERSKRRGCKADR